MRMVADFEPLPTHEPAGRTAGAPLAGAAGADGEAHVIEALRRGDESAFTQLVERHHPSMVRVARLYVASDAAAEEVAQEAWLGVLQGLDRFQGRCTVKAWIFAIVANCARSRGVRDKRTVPLSALIVEDEAGGPSVDPDRFLDDGHPRWPGHWSQPPQAWEADQLVSQETLRTIARAMEALPPTQRAVMTMRDVEGLGSEETCQVLGISEANQRVLLHRARSKVRAALESYMHGGEVSP
jgi:RNA polymerase sigma-70 factor (ECF subfamily)